MSNTEAYSVNLARLESLAVSVVVNPPADIDATIDIVVAACDAYRACSMRLHTLSALVDSMERLDIPRTQIPGAKP